MSEVKLIYLHGFNSSPDSFKAQAVKQRIINMPFVDEDGLDNFLEIPEIPPVPADAAKMLSTIAEKARENHTVAFAGSSLGGFYATWLAEKYDARAVLINPAVKPYDLLAKYLGENINYYTSERWMLEPSHIEQFRELDIDPITRPERYLLMLQKGDEKLDYRQAAKKYRGCPSVIEEGGDHSFVNFENHIDRMLAFCGFTL